MNFFETAFIFRHTTLVIAVEVAPVIKWQRWDSANYDWFGQNANDALPSLEAELDAWIAAVNGNASNVGYQLAKLRGYADSTVVNYGIMVISVEGGAGEDIAYLGFGAYGATSSFRCYMGTGYDNGTGNGGYGSITNGPYDSGISTRTSGVEANWLIAYDTADGEEFFSWGPTFDTRNASYEDGFHIIKRSNGSWMILCGDGTSKMGFSPIADFGTWMSPDLESGLNARYNTSGLPQADGNKGNRFIVMSNSFDYASSYISSPNTTSLTWVAANPYLLSPSGSSYVNCTGDRAVSTDLGNGNNVYMVTLSCYGPRLLMDLR